MNRNETRRGDRAQQPEQELHGVFAELAQILGDALVGIVDRPLQLDAVVAAAVEPMGEIVPGQPAPPAQAEIGADDRAGNGDGMKRAASQLKMRISRQKTASSLFWMLS